MIIYTGDVCDSDANEAVLIAGRDIVCMSVVSPPRRLSLRDSYLSHNQLIQHKLVPVVTNHTTKIKMPVTSGSIL